MASEPSTTPAEAPPPVPAEPAATQPPEPTIHEAELESGPSGRVLRGGAIDFDAAVARRLGSQNVVVCGDDPVANQRLAARIEGAIGRYVRADPHIRHAGPFAL